MHLVRLTLQEFRSYRELSLDLESAGLRVAGDNASGKSTLLEAIAMLATTRSPRASNERDLINWRSGEEYGVPPFSRVVGRVRRGGEEVEVEIGWQVDPARPTTVRKQIKLNGRAVRAMDAVGTLKAVLFSPEDVGLIAGSPSGRRRYLDLAISQIDPAYLLALSRFGRILGQRNSLLKSLARDRVRADSATADSQLAFWDEELLQHGSEIVARRASAVDRLNHLAQTSFRRLAGRDDLAIGYQPSFPLQAAAARGEPTAPYGSRLSVAAVRREYEDALRQQRGHEVRRGVSLVGPHREDVTFALGGVDVGTFGSRGQQRLVVVALKLAEVELMREAAGQPPILLLDDVLSELDARHRAMMIEGAIADGMQLVVTATDPDLLDLPNLAHLPLVRAEHGSLTRADGSAEDVSAVDRR